MDSHVPRPRLPSRRNEDLYKYAYNASDNGFKYYKKQKEQVNLGSLATMASWIQRQAGSHQVQLAATAVLSAAAVAGTIFGVQSIRRRAAVEELKASIPHIDEDHRLQKVRLPISSVHIFVDGD